MATCSAVLKIIFPVWESCISLSFTHSFSQVRTLDLLESRQHRHEGQGSQRTEIPGRHDPNHAGGSASRVDPECGHAGVGMRTPKKREVRKPR